MYHCKNCGCQVQPRTTKCPNCDENPYIFSRGKTFTKQEMEGRKKFFDALSKTRALLRDK